MARLSFTEVGLLLLLAVILSAESAKTTSKTLRRKKREWILPPSKLMENTDYTNRQYIAKIRSDKDSKEDVKYLLSGAGADKAPFNIFVVDPDTGYVRITAILDRELYAFYNLTGVAKFRNGTTAEDAIPLKITVLDQNDNAPRFELHTGTVKEASKKGTFVMQIEAEDDDQPGTVNSKISYSIISQEPADKGHMFTIDANTGKLYTKEDTLDRETHDFYKLIVKGSDLGGASGCLTGTGTVEIKVLDINDNIPTLEKSDYNGSVDENVADVVVMRIKALDQDLEHTDNWLTVFHIAKGNEDNLFSIETDKETNEGVLKLIKPVDFEEVQTLEIGLVIENIAPFVEGGPINMDVDVQVGEGGPAGAGAGAGAGVDVSVDVGVDAGVDVGVDAGVDAGVDVEAGVGVDAGLKPGVGVHPHGGPGVGVGLKPGVKPEAGGKLKPDAPSYTIKIAVNNMPEDPVFLPAIKDIPVSEDPNEAPEDGVIAVYPVVDPDTGKPAEDVSYAKAHDPGNWFTIDEETAEIKLNKAPDRESPHLVNGTYIAKILAITKDMPAKTATGTIAIHVIDHNDHCPTLTTSHTSLCSDLKTVYVTGFDEDSHPNGPPLTFRIIPDGTQGSWDVEVINATTAALHSHDAMWPGAYELQVEVSDAQGLSCPANEIFTVEVCTCVDSEDCGLKLLRTGKPSTELSAPAIGLLLLALCLLLLIPLLLLFCQCGGAGTIFPDQFKDLPFDVKQHLIAYHTEGIGEDKDVPVHSAPILLGNQHKLESAAAPNFSMFASKFTETHQESYEESMQQFQETSQNFVEVDNNYRFSRELLNHAGDSATFSRQTLGAQRTSALYDDMALPAAFLHDYYSQKSACVVPVKDSLLEYDYEGEGSSAGSVGCCSILEIDSDLQFLNDLEPKFKTLAAICSPPTPTPPPPVKHKIAGAVKTHRVDIAEPVAKPKIERHVETKHTDIKTEKVISNSSVSTASSVVASKTLPRSEITSISHSTNVSRSAALPRQVQTVILQQQPIYYTTTPVLQPVQYVVQPQLQNTVLLANGARGASYQGLYVVSGPQSPSSGLGIGGSQGGSSSGQVFCGNESSISPASPTSTVSPTLLVTGGLGVPQGPVAAEGWKIVSGPQSPSSGLGLSGSQSGSSSGLVVQGIESPRSPVSPTSTVSPTLLLSGGRGVSQAPVPAEGWKIVVPNPGANYMLVQDKSSPGEANKMDPGSSQGTLPRGAILVKEAAPPQGVSGLAAQRSVYGILPGRTQREGVVAVNSNLGQTWLGKPGKMGLGSVNVSGVGVGHQGLGMGYVVNLNSSLEQTMDPKKDNTKKTSAETKTQLTKKKVTRKHLIKDNRNPTQNTSEHNTTPDEEESTKVVQRKSSDNGVIQQYPTDASVTVDLEEDVVKSLPVLQAKPDTVLGTTDEIGPNQFNKLTEEFNHPQQNVEEDESKQQENEALSEGLPEEDTSVVVEILSTETFQTGSDVTGLVNTDKNTSSCPQGDGKTSTLDHTNTVNEQIDNMLEETMSREEAASLKQEEEMSVQHSAVEAPEDTITEVGSELQSKGITEDQSDWDEYVSVADEVVSDLEIAESDSIQADENMDEMATVPCESHEDVVAVQIQLSDSAEDLDTVGDFLATPNEISTDSENACDEGSISEEAIPELKAGHNEGNIINEGQAESDGQPSTVEASEDRSTDVGSEHQSIGITDDQSDLEEFVAVEEDIFSDLERKVIAKFDSIQADENTDDMATEVKAEQMQLLDSEEGLDTESDVSTIPPNEVSTDTENERDEGSTSDQEAIPELQAGHDEGNTIDGQAESDIPYSETALQTCSTILTNQEEEEDPDLNSIPGSEEMTTQDQDNDNQQKLTSESETESTDDGEKDESIVEEGVSQQISDQDEDDERACISFMEDPLTSDDKTIDEERDEMTLEERVSPPQQIISFSDDQEHADEYASDTGSEVDNSLISDNKISDSENEEEDEIDEEVGLSIQQNISITDNQDEEVQGEATSGTSSPLENQLVTGDDISPEEMREYVVEEVTSAIQPHLSISDGDYEEIGEGTVSGIYQEEGQFVEDNIRDEEEDIMEKEMSPTHQTAFFTDEDAVPQVDNLLNSHQSVCYGQTKAMSSQQKNGFFIDDEDEEDERNNALGSSSHAEGDYSVPQVENTLNSHQSVCYGQIKAMSVQQKNSFFLDDEDEEDERNNALGFSSHAEGDHDQSHQMFEEDFGPNQPEGLGEEGFFSATGLMDSSQTGDGDPDSSKRPASVSSADMEGLDVGFTSSEELSISRVATGQVSVSCPDQEHTMMASGEVAEGEISQGESSGHVSPRSSDTEVVDSTIEVQPIAGKSGSTEAEASGGATSRVQLQSVISQTPQNKSRKSKKVKSPKSPSAKCHQQ